MFTAPVPFDVHHAVQSAQRLITIVIRSPLLFLPADASLSVCLPLAAVRVRLMVRVRLPSKLRGRFEATKGPVVRCGTLVLGRLLDGIFTYSAGRRRESELNPGKDQTGNRCTLVFPWEKTRNKQNECTTQRVHGCGPACVIAWKMVLRNTGG